MLGSRVLQVVAKPSYHMVLEACWYDHFAVVTEYFGVFNQLGGVTFLFSISFEFLSSCCASSISPVVRG